MPMKPVHAVPMLSPVLEDFVPPQFRGNVPDSPRAEPETEASSAGVAPTENGAMASSGESGVDARMNTEFRARFLLRLLKWRKREKRRPVQVTTKKSVQVQGLRRQKPKYPRSKRAVGQCLNPCWLLRKLRDQYIHMMNSIAGSGIVPAGPMSHDSGTHSSTFLFSQEFDPNSIAELLELQQSGPQPNTEQYIAFARNLRSRGDDPLSLKKPRGDREPMLSKSKSSRVFSADDTLTKSGRRSSAKPTLQRSKSNSLSDDTFFARKLRTSGKKLHINPYLDTDWTPDMVSKGASEDFHFHREVMHSGAKIR